MMYRRRIYYNAEQKAAMFVHTHRRAKTPMALLICSLDVSRAKLWS